MNLRATLVLIATIIWFLLGGLTNWVCRECSDQTTSTQQNLVPGGPTTDSEANRGPLAFLWSNETPFPHSTKFEAYNDSLLNNYQEGDSLIITGYYFGDEENNTTSENLGLARAGKLKDLYSKYVDPDMIVLKSEMVDKRIGVEKEYFESASLQIVPGIPDLSAKAVVYFPYNSTSKIPNNAFDRYLGQLVEVLSKTDKTLTIYGHTDTIGGERYNLDLGRERAEVVRDIIISKGIDAERIRIFSKGFSDPASTNETEEGRRLNRRAELIVE